MTAVYCRHKAKNQKNNSLICGLLTLNSGFHCRLLEILEFAEDMEIDIPKIWTYLGELVGQMIQDGSVPLSFLKQASKPLVASNKAGIFVAEVLHDACHREVIRYEPRSEKTGLWGFRPGPTQTRM